MYEQHFGLAKRPFSVKATGTEVFVGPQTAKTMAGFRKALVAQDAVVTVSGPVGTGKTTLVERALDAIGTKYKTIRVGRMQMNSSDVLEALLVVLGVQERPAGTIQRFAALRRRLRELQDAETRVFILVEDAPRTGVETLAELEALTVGDAGESDGASIVLMGDETLFEFMRDPRLARLQQRVRRRHLINPLCVTEMLGYLKHSFRSAGGEYERIFDVHSAELFHYLSEGIPRVANNIVDAVLVAAAAEGLETVPATLIARIASEEFGLSAQGFKFSTVEPATDAVEETGSRPALEACEQPAAQPGAAAYAVDEPVPLSEPVADTLREPPAQPESRAEAVDEPAAEFNVSPEAASKPSPDDSPEASTAERHLIDNTLPDLAILSKNYATLPEEDAQAGRETVSEAETEASEYAGPGTASTPDASHELLKPQPESAGENGGGITRGLPPELTAASETPAKESNALEPPAPRVPVAENIPSEETDPIAVSSERVDIPELDPEPIAAAPSEPDETPRLEPASGPAATSDSDDIPELKPEPIAAAPSEPDDIPRLEPVSVPAATLDTDDIPELKPEPIAAAPSEPDESPALEPASVPAATLDTDDIPELEPEPVAAARSEPDCIPTLEADSMPVRASAAEKVPAIEANPVAASIFAPDNIPQQTPDSKPAAESDAPRIPEPAPEPVAATRIEPDNKPAQAGEVAPAAELDRDDVSELEAEPLAVTEAVAVAPEDLLDKPENAKQTFAGNALELERTPETGLGSDPAPDTTPGQQMTAETPEWDRDPTFAQLKPDLEALEKAMALAHREPAIPNKLEDAEVPPESNADTVVEHDDLPEITLDKSIETGLQDQLIEEPADVQPPRAKKPDVELERIAANIANAKTLEDMDDIMAETLFGTGISMIAAQIKLNPPSDDGETHAFADTPQSGAEAEADLQLMAETSQSEAEANPDLQLVAETPQRDAVAEADLQLVAETPPQPGAAQPLVRPTKPSPTVAMQREDISMETPAQAFNGGLIPSATQRLKTVRALNAAMNTSPRKRGKATKKGVLDASNEPQPIEDQINTSITQTLKALEISEHLIDDGPEEEPKRGFFSRFRKSKG